MFATVPASVPRIILINLVIIQYTYRESALGDTQGRFDIIEWGVGVEVGDSTETGNLLDCDPGTQIYAAQ